MKSVEHFVRHFFFMSACLIFPVLADFAMCGLQIVLWAKVEVF